MTKAPLVTWALRDLKDRRASRGLPDSAERRDPRELKGLTAPRVDRATRE